MGGRLPHGNEEEKEMVVLTAISFSLYIKGMADAHALHYPHSVPPA